MVGRKPGMILHGKSVYLDLFGYRNVAEIEKNLQFLGAVVEKCFSKEVSHVITNRATAVNSQTRGASKNVTVEAAIASPHSLSPFADSAGHQSPPITDAVSRPMTRGQAIVQKAMLSRKRGSTNVVECAQQWNIKVIHVDAAVKWMKKELEKFEAQKQEKKPKVVIQLTRPCIKFEDSRCCFCPEFKVLQGFPSPKFDGPPRTCPFDQFAQPCSVENAGNQAENFPRQKGASEADQRQVKDNDKRKRPDKEKRKFAGKSNVAVLSSEEQLMTAGELQKLRNHRIEAAKQKGFCEICDIKFDNVLQHLDTKEHKSYVEDVGHYQALDQLISQIEDRTIFQMTDPMNSFSKVLAPSSAVSSEADKYDLNLLSRPSSSLSSHFKMKISPEWSNSCSPFFWDRKGEVQAVSNAFLQNTSILFPKPQASAGETEPKEPGINYYAAGKMSQNRNNSSEKHYRFNELKLSDDVANCESFDKHMVNDWKNVGSVEDLDENSCENRTTCKASNTLRPDNIPGKLESESSCKMNAESRSSNISFMQQSDKVSSEIPVIQSMCHSEEACKLDSEGIHLSELSCEDVSSEIPVIQSMRHSKEACKINSEGMHVSAEPPIAQCFTVNPGGYGKNSEVAFSEFPVAKLPNQTGQVSEQSQLSYPASVIGSSSKHYLHHHSSEAHTPSKRHKRCYSDVMGNSLKCESLPLPEVSGSVEKCFLDGCKSQKRKRIKFSQAVSVLTDQSVLRLFASDNSSNFEGFANEEEQLVTDFSYDEVSEVLLSIDSDFEWASTSNYSRLDFESSDPKARTSIAPIIPSVTKGCTLSEADLKMNHYSETSVTHSGRDQTVLTLVDVPEFVSDSEFHFPNNAPLNFTDVYNHFRKDTSVFFTDSSHTVFTSQQEDIINYLDKEESNLLEEPLSFDEDCNSWSVKKGISRLNQLSIDNKSGSVIDVKFNQFPTKVKLPLTLANAKVTKSRSWQPVIPLRKCDDLKRGCDGDEEEISVSNLCSAVQSSSSDVYSLIEASNGIHKLRRKLKFSHVNDGQLSELEKNKSVRKKLKCSGTTKRLPSKDMNASSLSNADVLCCRVEIPDATNVLELVDLESNGKIDVTEVPITHRSSDGQELCCASSTFDQLDRDSITSNISDMNVNYETHSIFSECEHVQMFSSKGTTASAVNSNKTLKRNVFEVDEIPVLQTDDFSQISNDMACCKLKERELASNDPCVEEICSDDHVMGKMHMKFSYDKIRQNNKMWQPVVMLDRSSVNHDSSCLHDISVHGSGDGHVAKLPLTEKNGMISDKTLIGFRSASILGDALQSEVPFAHDEEVLSDTGKVSRSLVVLLNRCDSQLNDSYFAVSKQKMPLCKAGLHEKLSLFDIKCCEGCLLNAISLINRKKDINVTVDLNRSDGTHELCESEVRDVNTLNCTHGAYEKYTARTSCSRTFENSDLMHNSIDVNAKIKMNNVPLNLENTIVTDAVSGEPLETVGRISLPNPVLVQNSDVELVSVVGNFNGQRSNTKSETRLLTDGPDS